MSNYYVNQSGLVHKTTKRSELNALPLPALDTNSFFIAFNKFTITNNKFEEVALNKFKSFEHF